MLTQDDKINIDLIKKILIEKNTLPFFRNQGWKNAKVETEKIHIL